MNYSSFWRGKPQKSQNSEILWPLHCQVNWSLVLYISFVWTKMALARRISSQHMAPWCGSRRDLIKSTTRKGLRLSYCCMCLYVNIYVYIHQHSTYDMYVSVYCDTVCAITHTWMWICSKYFKTNILKWMDTFLPVCRYIYIWINNFPVIIPHTIQNQQKLQYVLANEVSEGTCSWSIN